MHAEYAAVLVSLLTVPAALPVTVHVSLLLYLSIGG